MLKTFNINEHYEPTVIPYLQSKKNQSNYICNLIIADMEREAKKVEEENIIDLIRAVVREENQRLKEEINNISKDVDNIKVDLKTEFKVLEAKMPYILKEYLENKL